MTYSMATVGCNFRCGFCQNWRISQAGSFQSAPAATVSPSEIVELAQENRCPSISYTYTEPTVYFEYAYETARLGHAAGLKNIFVTNGFLTREALETISPYLDAANVDLKSFSDSFYRKHCKGRLDPVLETIRLMKELGVWVEVTTLVIPSENDSEEELRQIANFLSSIAREIPWHISRFHPDYRMTDRENTPRDTLSLAADIGYSAGLTSVHIGNVP